jgi:hypothetical protein
LAVELPQYANSERAVRLVIESNDRKRPRAVCHVLANCPAPLVVEPKSVDFGELLADEVESAEELIRVRGEGGARLSRPDQLEITHHSEFIQVRREQGSEGSVSLRLGLTGGVPRGDLFDRIRLQLKDSDVGVALPVHARVVAPIFVVPSTVFLRIDPETGRFLPAEILVVSRRSRCPVGRCRLLEGPEDVVVEDLGDPGPTRRRIRLDVAGDGQWSSQTELCLACEGLKRPLSVKLVKPST